MRILFGYGRKFTDFMSIGVFSKYVKIFSAYSQNVFIFFMHILRARYNTFGVFREKNSKNKNDIFSVYA
jgi:hypothetical protein